MDHKIIPLAGLVVLVAGIVVGVGSVSQPKRVSTRASSQILTSVRIHPGEIIAIPSGPSIYLSSLAYDALGNPLFDGITYEWGLSTNASLGNLKTNNQLAEFIPSQNIGSGDLWVIARDDSSKVVGSSKITVSQYQFSDMASSRWSWKYVYQIANLGIMLPKSPNLFDPDSLITRTEMAKYLLNAYQYLSKTIPQTVTTPFVDIASLSADQQDDIAKLFGLGLTAGTSATTFSPNDNVDRAQMATFLVKLYTLITTINPPEVSIPFTDLESVEYAWAKKWVARLYGLKITAGTSQSTFSPELKVTREQMATFISNTLKNIPKELPSPSPSASSSPSPSPTPPQTVKNFDVVVVGAGTGGVSAAIAAARLGAKVALIEETDWIGGQMTAAGVSTIDGVGSGIFTEFINLVKNFYSSIGKSINTCYWNSSSLCFEPFVGHQVLLKMLEREPNISLILRSRITAISKDAGHISSLEYLDSNTKTINVIKTSVVVDADEYGDLLPLLEINYHLGNTTAQNLKTYSCIQDITYPAIIKKYPQGIPQELRMANPPPGYADNVPGFRKIVTTTGSKWDSKNLPVDVVTHNTYRGLPDSSSPTNYSATNYETAKLISKTQLNWANDYAVDTRYLQDRQYRFQSNCQAKLKTLQYIYYLQNELGLNQWSISNDEGYDTPYNREENNCPNIPDEYKNIEREFPLIPYVREGKRGIGYHFLTAKEIDRRHPEFFDSSIAIGNYAVDLHNCKSESDLESGIENLSDIPPGFLNGPFQIPFEVLVSADFENLIFSEKNISTSRLANGALRLQPVTMATGQAAGIIAGLSISKHIQPNKLDYHLVQNQLVLSGAEINYPVSSPSPVPTPSIPSAPDACLQTLTPARNITTLECQTFNNSCIPDGWMADSTCLTPSDPQVVSQFPQTINFFAQIIQLLQTFLERLIK